MNKPTRVSASVHYEEISLRELIEVLLRRKWLILSLVAAAMVGAGIVSYAVLPPRYESRITVDLSAVAYQPLVSERQVVNGGGRANGEEELGTPTVAYSTFAASNRVREAMVRLGSLDMTPAALEGALSFQFSPESGLLTVTASAPDAAVAQRLARIWYDAFASELLRYVQERTGQLLAAAEGELAQWESRLAEAQRALDEFESRVSVSLTASRVEQLESELTAAEATLRTLVQQVIPADEARLQALEAALAEQPVVLDDGGARVLVPVVDAQSGAAVVSVSLVNPVYVQVLQEIVSVRARLAANRRSAELLQVQLEQLLAEIADLREELVRQRQEWTRLSRDVAFYSSFVEEARARRDAILALQRLAQDTTVPPIISDPSLPDAPVGPQTLLNVVLAGVLAGFVGTGGALVAELWSGGPSERR